MVYLVENETIAEERAINRFHKMCFEKESVDYETLYKLLSHKDLARICARIAKQIQELQTYDDAEYEHSILFTH